MSQSKMSGEQAHQAMEFLLQLQQSGQLQYLLSQIPQGSFEDVHGGSMNDSSKRRLDEESVFSDEFIPVNLHSDEEADDHKKKVSQQMPVLPGASSLAVGIKLPSGIKDVKQWSTTLCELPKVVHMKKSYAQLVDMASESSDIKKYLKWILKYSGPSDRTLDFAAYLRATGFEQGEAFYPGGEVRRFV